MSEKKFFKKALQRTRIARYQTYKHIGCLRHQHKIDSVLVLMCATWLGIGGYFLIRPTQTPLEEELIAQEEAYINPDAQEQVHADLGDDPVVADTGLTLADLKARVEAGTATVKTYTLQKDETLSRLLSNAGISASEGLEITDTLALLVDLRTMRTGEDVLIFTDNQKAFLGLALPSRNAGNVAAVLKEEDGTYTPYSQEGRIETATERITGTIERTFSGSAQKAGIPKTIVDQITGAMNGVIDFTRLSAGDKFDIIYEKKMTSDGLELGHKQLLFVGIQSGKNHFYRYSYTDRSGVPAFYNPQGESGAQSIIKQPVKGRPRLSSPYGWRRHPVLMYRIFHAGADLAIGKGTPIFAAADGTITQIGRKGAYGKYIRIRHADGYETAYGHLNGYRAGLKRGSRVKRGEQIGYVGATGRVTGPHLHFEVWKNGKTQNPLHNHTIIGRKLTGFELEQFQTACANIHPDFERQLIGKIPTVPPQKPTFGKN